MCTKFKLLYIGMNICCQTVLVPRKVNKRSICLSINLYALSVPCQNLEHHAMLDLDENLQPHFSFWTLWELLILFARVPRPIIAKVGSTNKGAHGVSSKRLANQRGSRRKTEVKMFSFMRMPANPIVAIFFRIQRAGNKMTNVGNLGAHTHLSCKKSINSQQGKPYSVLL